MEPLLYKYCLDKISERDKLAPSEWNPVMLNDIITFENELKAELPKEYEEFLIAIGGGLELGGLAEWYHLDLSLKNNLIEANNKLLNHSEEHNPPKGFLAVYDCKDGTFFGFQRKHNTYLSDFMIWDSYDNDYEKYADNLFLFLDQNIDCSTEEIEEIQTSVGNLFVFSSNGSKPHNSNSKPKASA